MKFIYQYRTPDNRQHKGVVRAATKDDAYALLRQRGMKPGRVEEAPGFLNKLFGKGKRWLAIGVLGALCLMLIVIIARVRQDGDAASRSILDFTTRHQLLGDPAMIGRGVSESWREVFSRPCDRYLSCYAQPGVPVARVEAAVLKAVIDDMKANLGAEAVEVDETDFDEVRQIKRIVAGMRRELAEYVKDGGTVEQYVVCLAERQKYEVALRNRARDRLAQLRRARLPEREFVEEWKKANLELRKFGIAFVPLDGDE